MPTPVRRPPHALLSLLLLGCAEGPDALPLDNSPVVVLDGDQVSQPTWVQNIEGYRSIARESRAVGHLHAANKNECSGFLISDDVFVTSETCVGDDAQIIVTFGLYGSNFFPYIFPDGGWHDSWNTSRAAGAIDYSGQPPVYSCARAASDPTGDAVFYECQPQIVNFNLVNGLGTPWSVPVYPGEVWGHLDLGTIPAVGAEVVLDSMFTECSPAYVRVWLSDGIMGTAASCPQYKESGCFEVSTDATASSLGGPLVSKATGDVFGLLAVEWLGGPSDPCVPQPPPATNVGSPLGPMAAMFAAGPPAGGQPVSPPGYASNWVGGQGGMPHPWSCPPNMLVAGIVGNRTHANPFGEELNQNDTPTDEFNWAPEYTGNLGFICVPNRSDRRRLDDAVVNTGGSANTDFHVAVNEDLNRYIHRQLWEDQGLTGEQSFHMCPSGMFLHGITAATGAYVNGIRVLHCSTLDGSATTQARPFFIGTPTVYGPPLLNLSEWTPSPNGNEVTASCPAGSFIASGTIHADWWTDGFDVQCHVPY